MRAAIALLSLGMAISACSYHVNKGGAQENAFIPAFTRAELSYALVSQYVLGPRCVACHGQSGGISLETYGEVIKHLSGVEAAALIAKTMPKAPNGSLSASEAQLLRDWIEAGAPEFPGGSAPPAPVLEPRFASIHDQIFEKKCMSCHNPSGSAKDVPLDTIADLLQSPDDLVIPGDPASSYLAIMISPGARRPMPPLSSGLRLSSEEINVIVEWIKNGAKD